MERKSPATKAAPGPVALGENPINSYNARKYARESSPGTQHVIIDLTENARDYATNVTLTLDISQIRQDKQGTILTLRKITCADNGVGMTHQEFCERFCGAYSDSTGHFDIDHSGRNGVGTKTYMSIADRVNVRTTTGRPSEGFNTDEAKAEIQQALPAGLSLPGDGCPDDIWRYYEFKLHTRAALPHLWTKAAADEMGTVVELLDLIEPTEIVLENIIERLSYHRDWLKNPRNALTIVITGDVPQKYEGRREIKIKPWNPPTLDWLVKAQGTSDKPFRIIYGSESVDVPANIDLPGVLEFDFRVVGKGSDGQMLKLEKPALLLEICGTLPYAPNLEGVLSARTVPLLGFVGLDNATSIGVFRNAVCGHARINAMKLKDALRNNKTTLSPGMKDVEILREYLRNMLAILHRAWYTATRSSESEATANALKEAEQEINFALTGAQPGPDKGGDIEKKKRGQKSTASPSPTKRHRWECAACSKKWLAPAEFKPTECAETASGVHLGGCGSSNIGLAENQPRIGECIIIEDQLGDKKLPAVFQYENQGDEIEQPVVRINKLNPRFLELRGRGPLSGPAQDKLKQYLVDIALVSIAKHKAEVGSSDIMDELGQLQYNRMLKIAGYKVYERLVNETLESESKELVLSA